MKMTTQLIRPLVLALGAALLLGLGACRKSDEDQAYKAVRTPKEAAAQLEQAFADASPDAKQNAGLAAQAMRSGDYEKAVMSLQALRRSGSVNLQQGLAIQGTIVALETTLIEAMDAGNANAKRAYELLKQMKRN